MYLLAAKSVINTTGYDMKFRSTESEISEIMRPAIIIEGKEFYRLEYINDNTDKLRENGTQNSNFWNSVIVVGKAQHIKKYIYSLDTIFRDNVRTYSWIPIN